MPEMDTNHYQLYGRIGGLTTLARHGAQKCVEPALRGRAARYRQQAIELGATTEEEIREKVRILLRLHAAKMAKARWANTAANSAKKETAARAA